MRWRATRGLTVGAPRWMALRYHEPPDGYDGNFRPYLTSKLTRSEFIAPGRTVCPLPP